MFKFCNEWSMRFQVVMQHSEEALRHISSRVREYGMQVLNVREADIRQDSDNSKVGEVYILVCRGFRGAFLKLKSDMQLDEIEYEGLRTLI